MTGPIGPLLESLLLVSRCPQQALQASLESVWEGCAQQHEFWKPQLMAGRAPVEQPACHPSTLWPLMVQVPPAWRPQNHTSLLLLAYHMQQCQKQVICPCKTHIPWGSTGKVNRHPVQKGKEGRTLCSHGHWAGLKCSGRCHNAPLRAHVLWRVIPSPSLFRGGLLPLPLGPAPQSSSLFHGEMFAA